MNLIKRIVRFVIHVAILLSFVFIGYVISPVLGHKHAAGYLAASSYLYGCVEAKIEQNGQTGGANFNVCAVRAKDVYNSIVNIKGF